MDRRKVSLVLAALLVLTAALVPPATAAEDGRSPFSDVKAEDPFYEAVSDVYERGLMNGIGAETFAPYASATRAMMATVFYRMEGFPDASVFGSFPDVPAG